MNAADRLHRRSEFILIQRGGNRSQSAHFVLYAMRFTEPGRSRLGITVSRRIGNAVVRNRVKRRVRECYRRLLRPMIPAGTGMVIIARGGCGDLDQPTINDELRAATLNIGRKL